MATISIIFLLLGLSVTVLAKPNNKELTSAVVVSDEATIWTQVPSEKSHLKENANQPQEIDAAPKFLVPSNGVFSMF